MKYFSTWSPGLTTNGEALSMLEKSGIISGIELWNTDGHVGNIRDAGLDVCMHVPGRMATINLADPDYSTKLSHDGYRIKEVVRGSESGVFGLHCGYSVRRLVNRGDSLRPFSETDYITNRDEVLERISENIIFMDEWINDHAGDYSKKIAIENLPRYTEGEATEKNRDVGVTRFVTRPDFFSDIFRKIGCVGYGIGLLYDISHAMITVSTMKANGNEINNNDYLGAMLEACNKKVYEVHVSVPERGVYGLFDAHKPLGFDEEMDNGVIGQLILLLESSNCIENIVLEMYTGNDPIKHARTIIEQAEGIDKMIGSYVRLSDQVISKPTQRHRSLT